VAAVVIAVGWRLAEGWPDGAGGRIAAGLASIVAVIALAAWATAGPLRPGWARRAGTPPSLLAGSRTKIPGKPATSSSPPVTAVPVALPPPPYHAALTGTMTQQTQSGGSVRLDIRAQTSGTLVAVLDVIISGTPDGSGGVIMHESQASFGPPATPAEFRGQITGLDGPQMTMALADSAGARIDLRANVSIAGNRVTGELISVSATRDEGAVGDDH
jgi:hypothetical protein